MSGEIGGVILGGSVLLGAMPLLLAGVAVAGTLAGAAALGRSMEKADEEAARRRREEMRVSACSEDLSKAYAQFQSMMERQSRQNVAFYQKMDERMEQFSDSLRMEMDKNANEQSLLNRLNETRRNTSRMFQTARTEELARIRAETERETAQILSALNEAQQTKMDVVAWNQKTAAAQAGQKAMAQEFMRDAETSVRLLQTLASSSADSEFRARAETLSQSCRRASRFLEEGIFQSASAEAQKIITTSASLSMEYQRRQFEKGQIQIALESRLEGLTAELESLSQVTFLDDLYGEVTESMDDFTQGEFSAVQQEADEMLSLLKRGEGRQYSAFRLSQMLDDVEERLLPHAQEVCRVGRENMMFYYERLHALQITGNYMKEQGYIMEWAQPVGDDVTQKLVVHFREPGSGNTIAISLDEDADGRDIEKMAMEVMLYYANGRPVTEDEKKALREGVVGALRNAGLGGALHCTGRVNQEAGDKTMDNEEALRALTPARIFSETQAAL